MERGAGQVSLTASDPGVDISATSPHVAEVPTTDIGPDYSITSSARSSNVGRIVRPSALAVVRWMTSGVSATNYRTYHILIATLFSYRVPCRTRKDTARRPCCQRA